MPPDRGVDLGHALQLPPAGAIAYLRTKGYAISWRWWDVWQEAHQRAFTVAKMARLDLLQQTRAIIDRALATGMTERQAAAILEERLRAAGWWGRKVIVDPDGRAERVRLGSPHRIRTILRTNLLSAYAAGSYARQRETRKARPYWMYVAVLDPSTRDRHRALHGTILPADSPAWDAIYPPNGFNCRCSVRALTEAQVKAMGRRVVTDARVSDVDQEVGVNRETGEVITRPGRRISWKQGGETRTFTPDPGWSHRPGSTLVRPGGGGTPGPDEPTWQTFSRPAAADLPVAPPLADPAAALIDPPRVAHRPRVRTLIGDAPSAHAYVRTPVERVSVTRCRAGEDARLVPALADPDEVWLTHYPATTARRAEYRVQYLRATADGGDVVTVRPDGSLSVASVSRAQLDRRRRGVLLHARGAPPRGAPQAPAEPEPWPLADDAPRETLLSVAHEMADDLDQRSAAWRESLSEEQREAIGAYSRGLYQPLNRTLRPSAPDLDAEVGFLVDAPGELQRRTMTVRHAREVLLSAIESAPTPPPPRVVYRTLGDSVSWDRERIRVGHVIEARGFNSTSISTRGYQLQGGNIMEIVPREGAWLDPLSQYGRHRDRHRAELELLMRDGAKLKYEGEVEVSYNGTPKKITRWRELEPDAEVTPTDDDVSGAAAARDFGDPDKFTLPGHAAVLIGSVPPDYIPRPASRRR